MPFGSPIAALDVVLGIAGLENVLGGLRQLDREMAKQQQTRAPRGIQFNDAADSVQRARSQAQMWSAASTSAARYERSLGGLEKALRANTQDYRAAKQAQDAISAGRDAQSQVTAARQAAAATRERGRVAIETARSTARANTQTAQDSYRLAREGGRVAVEAARNTARVDRETAVGRALAVRTTGRAQVEAARLAAAANNSRAQGALASARASDQAAVSWLRNERAGVAATRQQIAGAGQQMRVLTQQRAVVLGNARAAEANANTQTATLRKQWQQYEGIQQKIASTTLTLKKQRDEIGVRQGRATDPLIRKEFGETVTGQRLNEARAAAVAAGTSTKEIDTEIGRHIRARTDAHRIAIDSMQRQESRYADAVVRLQGAGAKKLVDITNARAGAASAIVARSAAQAAVPAAEAAVATQKTVLQRLQAQLATRQGGVQAAQAARGTTSNAVTAAVQNAATVRANGQATVATAQATAAAATRTAVQQVAAVRQAGQLSVRTAIATAGAATRAAGANLNLVRQTGQAAVQTTVASARAATQGALANATNLATRLAPTIAAGGATAVAQFQQAMSGLNPLQYVQGIVGAAGQVVADSVRTLMDLGTAAMNVFGVLGSVLGGVFKAGGAIVGAFGSALGGVLGLVGHAASAVVGFFASPLVSAPLTAGLSLVIDHFGEIVRVAGLAGGAVAAFAAQQVVTQGISFEQSLSSVQASAGYSPGLGNNPEAVAKEMQRLEPLILQIGAETKYNNAEVANGVQMLLRGGLPSQAINANTIRALFNSSAATDSSVDDTAKVIDAMVQLFHLPESQMTHVADMAAGVVNSSMMTMGEYGSALRQLGPLAQTMGISPDDSSTALTMLAGAGFRGEIGGTALRNMLIYTNPRSKPAEKELKDAGIIDAQGQNHFFDEKGNLKSLPAIFDVLRQATKGMNDEDQLQFFTKVFGTRSASAAQVQSGLDPSKWGQVQGRITGQSAASTAAVQLDNVAGKWEILSGTLESLAAQFYMNWLASPLNKFLESLTDKVNIVYRFATSTDGLTASFKSMFGEQTRLMAFVGLVKDFVTAGNFKGSEDFVEGLRQIFAMGGDSRLFDLLPFIKNIEPWIMRLTRGIQLGRDAIITFGEAFSGNWAGAATTSINPLIRIIGTFGTYWGQVWDTLYKGATGKVDFTGFLGGLSQALTTLLINLGAIVDTDGPGIAAKLGTIWNKLKDQGTIWYHQYLEPEVELLWGGITAWIESKKPALVEAWNGLWATLGVAAPPQPGPSNYFIPGLPGSVGKGFVPEQTQPQAQQATGLAAIFGKLLDDAQAVLDARVKPVLDSIWLHLNEWWKENEKPIGTFGAQVGSAIAAGMIAGVQGLIGPNWFQDILKGAGLPKDVIDKVFPSRAPDDTKLIPGVIPGSTVRVPKDYQVGPDPVGGVINAVRGGAGALSDAGGLVASLLLGHGGASLDPRETYYRGFGAQAQLPKGGGDDVTWDDALGRWVPKSYNLPGGGGGGGGGNLFNPLGGPLVASASPVAPYFPSAGVTGAAGGDTGGAAGADLPAMVAQMGQMLGAAIAAAALPRTITVDAKGLTSVEFYRELHTMLEPLLNGTGGGGGTGAAGGERDLSRA